MWITLSVVDEKGAKHVLKFIANFHLSAIPEELDHINALKDVVRKFSINLLI